MGADPRRLGGLALAASCGFALLIGASAAAVGKTTVRTANASSLGTIVVGPTGRTVYRFLDDHGKHITCTGACAKQWPPLLVAKSAKPTAGAGITASKLGTITRPDGTVQVTYNGYPLYLFAGDSKTGQANGQGLEKLWYVLSPSGAVVKLSVSSPADSSAGTSGGGSSSSAPTSTAPTTSAPSSSAPSSGGYGDGY
jgi:predicted lipoprotein with Yx(FWY)xxD motif